MSEKTIHKEKSAQKLQIVPKTIESSGAIFDQSLPSLGLFDNRATLPGSLSIQQKNLLALQRTAGNGAVQRLMIQRETEEVKREEFQKKVSTPVPATAVIGDGKATMELGGAQVTILPDTITKDKEWEGMAVTSGGITDWATPGYVLDDDGKVESFDEIKTPKVSIQTTYGPDAKASDESSYGRGTTEADEAAGNTSLGFHEGMHGKTTLDYLKNNPLPKFTGTVGMKKKEFEAAKAEYEKKMKEAEKKLQEIQIEKVDCVGDKADFCKSKEEHKH